MKPRLIVHIGTHKTGSTSIQKTLYDAREHLLSQGVLFPSTEGGLRKSKHQALAQVAKNGDEATRQAEHDTLVQEAKASNAHTVILSAEGFSALQGVAADYFKRFVDEFDIQVICYLRRQDYFVESLYNQTMRDPENAGTYAVNEFWRDARTHQRLDYHKMLSAWAAIPAQVTALDFAQEVKRVGLVASFLEAAGLSNLGIALDDRVANRSPDMRLILALRAMRLQGAPHEYRKLARAGRALEASGRFPLLKHILGSRERDTILHTFAEGNARLASDFGVHFSDERPHEGKNVVVEPDTAYLMALIAALSQGRQKDAAEQAPLTEEELAAKVERRSARLARKQELEDGKARKLEKRGKSGKSGVDNPAKVERKARRAAMTDEEKAALRSQREAERAAGERPPKRAKPARSPDEATPVGAEARAARRAARSPEERAERKAARKQANPA